MSKFGDPIQLDSVPPKSLLAWSFIFGCLLMQGRMETLVTKLGVWNWELCLSEGL